LLSFHVTVYGGGLGKDSMLMFIFMDKDLSLI